MRYVVLDFEATCWDGFVTNPTQEIIEIGAIFISPLGEQQGGFHSFVRPWINPILSIYCKNLTGIEQADVDGAPYFDSVWENFDEALSRQAPGEDWVMVSWGKKDMLFWKTACELSGTFDFFEGRHIDAKESFARLRNLPRKVGLKKALSIENIEFEGSAHRAMDDASMLLKLFLLHFGQWS